MTRRAALLVLMAGVGAVPAGSIGWKLGRVRGSDPIARRLRCTVNGVDVTERCFDADDRAGWARCFALLPGGGKFIRPGEPMYLPGGGLNLASETLRGDVRFTWRPNDQT